jgi:cell wall-associated NlpC family hydrolase
MQFLKKQKMVKNLLGALVVSAVLASCGAVKTIQQRTDLNNQQDVKFIDDISFSPERVKTTQTFSEVQYGTSKGPNAEQIVNQPQKSTKPSTNNTLSPKDIALQERFAFYMNCEPEEVKNLTLYRELENWLGTRYVYGGTSHRGVDCSSLMQHLYKDAFKKSIPRTAHEQFGYTERISRTELKEGDLIFFNTTGGVSHVGIYLQNDYFCHASSSRGVTISNLTENYYRARYIGAGRVK